MVKLCLITLSYNSSVNEYHNLYYNIWNETFFISRNCSQITAVGQYNFNNSLVVFKDCSTTGLCEYIWSQMPVLSFDDHELIHFIVPSSKGYYWI